MGGRSVVHLKNVLVSSYLRDPEAPNKQQWLSCFADRTAHEFFSLRRPNGLFGRFVGRREHFSVSVEIEAAYYGGVLFPYFGHFLLESLSMLPNIEAGNTKIVFSLLNNTLTKWQRDFLDLLGLTDRAIFTKNDSYIQVGTLYKADQTTVIHCDVSRKFLEFFGRAVRSQPGQYPERLYVSRRLIKNAPTRGEEALERRLAALGFTVFHPEKHSAAEQVSFLREAKEIVAIEGSALHTLIFNGLSRKRVIVLSRRIPISPSLLRQFGVQPEIEVEIIECMKTYARTFTDATVLDVDLAVTEIQERLKRASLSR